MDFENGISGRKQMDGLMDSQLLTVGLQTNVSPARECKELSKKKISFPHNTSFSTLNDC